MKIKISAAILIFSVLFACKQNKNAAVAPKETPNSNTSTAPVAPVHDTVVQAVPAKAEEIKSDPKDSLMAVIVSFYSIGSGIDRGQPEKLKSFVEFFSKQINKRIEYAETHWGREGETDYCFTLNGLTGDESKKFLIGAKESLKAAGHVHFLQNQPCRKERILHRE